MSHYFQASFTDAIVIIFVIKCNVKSFTFLGNRGVAFCNQPVESAKRTPTQLHAMRPYILAAHAPAFYNSKAPNATARSKTPDTLTKRFCGGAAFCSCGPCVLVGLTYDVYVDSWPLANVVVTSTMASTTPPPGVTVATTVWPCALVVVMVLGVDACVVVTGGG